MEKNMQLPKIYASQVKKQTIDMSLSINPLGCSPVVLKMLRNISAAEISSYPKQSVLIKSICQKFSVQQSAVILGNGSEQLIKLICQTFLNPQDSVLTEKGSFPLFSKEALLANARVCFFDGNGRFQCKQGTRLLFLANPKTPTGEALNNNEITKLVMRCKPKISVIDEANGEFLGESFSTVATKTTNVIVLRTFSKVFGLAGLRVAFAIGAKSIIARLKETQQPFPVSEVAVQAGVAAINDKQFVTNTIQFFKKERQFLTKELQQRGFRVSKSMTNNLFICTSQASVIITELKKLDVAVIDGKFFPKNPLTGFRISIKDRRTNKLFLEKLDTAMACVKGKNLLPSKEVL